MAAEREGMSQPWGASSSGPRAGPIPASSRSGIRPTSRRASGCPGTPSASRRSRSTRPSTRSRPRHRRPLGGADARRLHLRRQAPPAALAPLGRARLAAAGPARDRRDDGARPRAARRQAPGRAGRPHRSRPSSRWSARASSTPSCSSSRPASRPAATSSTSSRRWSSAWRRIRWRSSCAAARGCAATKPSGTLAWMRGPRRRLGRAPTRPDADAPDDHAAARRGHRRDSSPTSARTAATPRATSTRPLRWPSASPGATATRSSRRSAARGTRARRAGRRGPRHVQQQPRLATRPSPPSGCASCLSAGVR